MTNIEKAEQYVSKIKNEQETILELLKPHFGDTLKWESGFLLVCDTPVMGKYDASFYDNDYKNIYEDTGIDKNTVFNKFGALTFDELCEAIVDPWLLKVKELDIEPEAWDLNEELSMLAGRYDWLDAKSYHLGVVELRCVPGTKYCIGAYNLVSVLGLFHMSNWCGDKIETTLVFDDHGNCELTEDNYEEFKRVIDEMDKRINFKWTLEWAMNDLLESFEWLEKPDSHIFVRDTHEVVVDSGGDVNYDWGADILMGNPTFKFDGAGTVILTEENYEDFKGVLKWYEDNILNIKKPWEEE